MSNKTTYYPTIGIECHVQLKTKTKLFSGVSNDARDAAPNTVVSHICLGMPGALPVLNEAAVGLAIRAALAFGTVPQKYSFFERKHYFYPDLPKGYQITQLSHPIVQGGEVTITADGKQHVVKLNRVQLEEDAGKSTHPAGQDYSLVDLNRAGTPLLEIVSEPDLHSAAQAKAYATELWLLMRFADISDADLYHGNMRFDVNVSLSSDPKKLGTRSETKNLNSFRSVEKAVEYEIRRQTAILDKGQAVVQETRGWDDAKQKTFSQREKEEAHDYRYFPDPDIPPIILDDAKIEAVRKSLPKLPQQWRETLGKIGLESQHITTLLEAEVDGQVVPSLALIDALHAQPIEAKAVANWLVNVEIPLYRAGQARHELDQAARLRLYQEVYKLLKADKLNASSAKSLLHTIFTSGAKPTDLAVYAEQQGFIQVSDESLITALVAKVIAEHPQAAADVKNGEVKAIGFLVGQVMQQSQGKANPQLVQTLIKQQLL